MESQSNYLSTTGAEPGIEPNRIASLPAGSGHTTVTCIDFSPTQFLIQEISDLAEFVSHHRPEWSKVRWISVDGLSNMQAIQTLATKYDLHPLAIEDLLHTRQRPKVDSYGGEGSDYIARLFIVARALRIQEDRLQHEQVSFFLGHNTLLTFQESHRSEWEPIYQRIKSKGSRVRTNDASFLAYALLDSLVDGCFPILEFYSERAEQLEDHILEHATPSVINEIHQLKRDLLLLRWVIWPLREAVLNLQRDPHECISDTTRVYLRDLYDHVIQIIDIIETYREIASDLTDTYMTSVSNRMNEIMKVLTMIGTIFIPLTFLAGVYGMNFQYLPELGQIWGYPAFWFISILVAIFMVIFFRRQHWL